LEAANTSKGGFYNHFASKEELFCEVLREAQRIWQEKVLTGLGEIESPIEKLYGCWKITGISASKMITISLEAL
jgi:AcrR family transcriptional regulator